MAAEPHAWLIYHMTEVMQTKVKSSLMEVNSKILDMGEVFKLLCPELALGKCFLDCFLEHVTFFKKPQGMKSEDWMDTLDKAMDQACQLTDHMSVFSDASSTKKDHLQAASAAFIEWRGLDLVWIKYPTGRLLLMQSSLPYILVFSGAYSLRTLRLFWSLLTAWHLHMHVWTLLPTQVNHTLWW
jgi:hypothetical protein